MCTLTKTKHFVCTYSDKLCTNRKVLQYETSSNHVYPSFHSSPNHTQPRTTNPAVVEVLRSSSVHVQTHARWFNVNVSSPISIQGFNRSAQTNQHLIAELQGASLGVIEVEWTCTPDCVIEASSDGQKGKFVYLGSGEVLGSRHWVDVRGVGKVLGVDHSIGFHATSFVDMVKEVQIEKLVVDWVRLDDQGNRLVLSPELACDWEVRDLVMGQTVIKGLNTHILITRPIYKPVDVYILCNTTSMTMYLPPSLYAPRNGRISISNSLIYTHGWTNMEKLLFRFGYQDVLLSTFQSTAFLEWALPIETKVWVQALDTPW